MPGKFEAPRGKKPAAPKPGSKPRVTPKKKTKKRTSPLMVVLIVLIILLILSMAGLLMLPKLLNRPRPTELPMGTDIITEPPETEPETEPETTVPVPESVVSTASVAATGDLLMHGPIFMEQYRAECFKGPGDYDFDSVFQYIKYDISSFDYAAANLETTLAGTGRPYSGYPNFNCPDAIAEDAAEAGFDMLLTANNHCFDTGMDGYQRTLEVVKSAGLETLGTMSSGEDPKYLIQDINGIKVGMVCYTYETSNHGGSYPSLNGLPMMGGSYDMINTFVPAAPQMFYDEIGGYITDMKAEGAEAVIVFIHWGVEYVMQANDNQKAIAQKLCDLGADVIVGGHPHVVEPVALLESTVDPGHKTVCIYSLGNAVSNQRTGGSALFPAGYTEDGVIFSVTFEKYSDGKVYLRNTDVIPTWVTKFQNSSGKIEYNILPLTNPAAEDWGERFQIQDVTVAAAKKSRERTLGIVGEGLELCKAYLEQAKVDREQYYYDLAFFPERFNEDSTPIAEETVEEPAAEAVTEIPAEDTANPEMQDEAA